MIEGTYIHTSADMMDRGRTVTVKAKETAKSFTFTLVDFGLRYPMAGFDGVWKKGKLVVRKDGSPHAIVNGQDMFVIYPYRVGVPFTFEMVTDNKSRGKDSENGTNT